MGPPRGPFVTIRQVLRPARPGGPPSPPSLGQGWLCTARSSGSRTVSLWINSFASSVALGSGVREARVGLAHRCHYPVWPAHLEAGVGHTCTLWRHSALRGPIRAGVVITCARRPGRTHLKRRQPPFFWERLFAREMAVQAPLGCPSTRSAGHRCPRSLVGAALEGAGVETAPISHRKQTRSPTPSSLLPRDSGLLPVTLILKCIWPRVRLIIQAGSHGAPAARCSENPDEGLKVRSGKVTTQMLSCGAWVTSPPPPPHHRGLWSHYLFMVLMASARGDGRSPTLGMAFPPRNQGAGLRGPLCKHSHRPSRGLGVPDQIRTSDENAAEKSKEGGGGCERGIRSPSFPSILSPQTTARLP